MEVPNMEEGHASLGYSNSALQDYQMQMVLLEQQNKKRLLGAREVQEEETPDMKEGHAPPEAST